MDRMTLGVVLGVVALGVGTGACTLDPSGDQQASCEQVESSLEPQYATIARTFGDGAEGVAALAHVVRVMEDRPDCYSPEAVEAMRANRDQPRQPQQTDEAVGEDGRDG